MAKEKPLSGPSATGDVKESLLRLRNALEGYERDHPQWRIEVLVSLITRGLVGLKRELEAPGKPEITWKHPFVELHYPVEWDWNAPREESVVNNKLTSGRLTKDNTIDAETTEKTLLEIMVQHLNILALQDFTNHAWIEKFEGKYNSVLPERVCAELNAIKSKRARQEALDSVMRPFSIGA